MTTFAIGTSALGARGRARRARRSPLAPLLRRLRRWEDQVHLHALSDHMLRDMGFERDQIDDVMRGRLRR